MTCNCANYAFCCLSSKVWHFHSCTTSTNPFFLRPKKHKTRVLALAWIFHRLSQPVFDWKVRRCAYRWVNAGARWLHSSSVEPLFFFPKPYTGNFIHFSYICVLLLNSAWLLLCINRLSLFDLVNRRITDLHDVTLSGSTSAEMWSQSR